MFKFMLEYYTFLLYNIYIRFKEISNEAKRNDIAFQRQTRRARYDTLNCTHLNDNFGKDVLHLAPFSGNIKWETVMKGLRDINYTGTLNLGIGINSLAPNELKDIGAMYALETLKEMVKL